MTNTFYRKNNDQDVLEVCLVLFTKCNLNCPFCFQNRSSIDAQYIKEIPQNLDIAYSKLSKKYNKILYRIWGGELFADNIDDSIFILYKQLVDKLNEIGKKHGFETQVCFSTNLVFNNVNRVKELIKTTNAIVATSYDPKYRFHNDEQIAIWQKNAEIFKPCAVSITLTKQNINAFIEESEHFERISKYPVNIEYYIFNKLHEKFKPSEDDLFKFFKYCIDNNIHCIAEVEAVKSSLDNPIGRYCNCNNSCLYLNGSLTFNCLKRSSNLSQLEFFDVIPAEDDYTEIQLREALNRKNCMLCKNFSFCRMYCMASVLHKSVDNSQCGMFKVYEYLRNLRCQ